MNVWKLILGAGVVALGTLGCAENEPMPAEYASGTTAQANLDEVDVTPPAPEQEAENAPPPHSCPMGVPGASVESADVEGGAALDFRPSDPADLPDLRDRVNDMAEHQGNGCGCPTMGGMNAPRASVSVEAIDGGYAIVFRAKRGRDVRMLRNMVSAEAARLRHGGSCMMQ